MQTQKNEYSNADLIKHPLVKKAMRTILAGMRNKINRGWTQGAMGRDRDFKSIDPNDNKCSFFSIIGALRTEEPNHRMQLLVAYAIKQSIQSTYREYPIGLSEWNDLATTNKEKVLRVLEHAFMGASK